MGSTDTSTEAPVPFRVVVVGAGPRGVSIVERIAAGGLGGDAPEIEIHLVDPAPAGAGEVWRTDQSRELNMNTYAGAVTLFTEQTTEAVLPVVAGPTLLEWADLVVEHLAPPRLGDEHASRLRSIDPAVRATFAERPPSAALVAPGGFLDELAAVELDSHASRALYGAYLEWALDRATAALPSASSVHVHRARAVGIEPAGHVDVVELDDGARLVADAVVLAQGWLPSAPSPADAALRDRARGSGAVWIEPASPIDQPVERVPDGVDVLVRGLGMGFFDTVTLLTVGRGGRHELGTDGASVYVPSGREPRFHAASGRGLPFRAKSRYGSLPPAGGHERLRAVVPRLHGTVDFVRDLRPALRRDALDAYYATLHRTNPAAFTAPLEVVLGIVESRADDLDELDRALRDVVPDAADRFDPVAATTLPAGRFASSDALHDEIVARLRADLVEAERGHDSPIKVGLWSLASARAAVSRVAAFDGLDAEDAAGPLHEFMQIGNLAGSGPPAQRIRELLALVDAGLVTFVGPRPIVDIDEATGRFVMSSPDVEAEPVTAPVLIDAWVRPHDVRTTRDELLRRLVEDGRARPFARVSGLGGRVPTSAVDVDPVTSRIVHGDGTTDERIRLIGVPLATSRRDTLISPMPGTRATMLVETDAVAADLLAQARAQRSVRSRSTNASTSASSRSAE
ncbi:FAD/NAD(P)-binding protein [Pseudoclavibacter chungangensis]|uniref:FAD/NAD(P)-binding protein n=1 Tax=Pseudoclavibacter chungangensis TaxID=587635 RepID=A0A7J5BQV3_9MICO|nr:FAD/NAD(P)-binding protein [Pseudoclavibacter chungangensis]KAB1656320.1 FAD/NAD(P)-binding protein [Pseudoclavibacter chungangensis]NYJ67086.1 putative NAD(P)/FAD-binding protein YdhS [Pseudoclavibacter chungangensis]